MDKNEQGYNGWTNYETWNVKLWIDNDQGTQEYWQEAAQQAWNDAEPGEYEWQSKESQAASALAKRLEEEHDEQRDALVGITGVFADLMTHALGCVEWREIAENMLSDVDKTA